MCDKHFETFSKFRIITSVPLLLVVITGALGRLTKEPKNNNIVLERATAEFTCCSNVEKLFFWTVKPIGSQSTNEIYDTSGLINGFRTSGRFNVTDGSIPGCYSLTITEVNRENAGTYSCVDNEGFGQKISWQLVILESFDCQEMHRKAEYMGENNFGLPQDVISTVCISKYFGNVPPKPICEWYSGTQMRNNHQHITETNVHLTLSIHMPAVKNFNADQISCYVEIDGKSSDNQTLTAWKSSNLIINHASFHQRGVSECSVEELSLDCHPLCNYTMLSYSNGSSYCEIAYPSKTIQKCYVLLQGNRTINIHGSTHNPVECQTPPSGTVPIILTSFIAGILVIGMFVGVTVYIYHRCKRRRLTRGSAEVIELAESRRAENIRNVPVQCHVEDDPIMEQAAQSVTSSFIQQRSVCPDNPESLQFISGKELY